MITSEVVNQAIDYIMHHIGEKISLDDVADYCHFSKYYFSRIFKEETGESVYSFIKRMKMDQSAFRLKVDKEKTITDVGLEYGYSSSNYSSAFKKQHNSSPVSFRENILQKSIEHPFKQGKVCELKSFEECQKKITIEWIEDREVIYERQIGSYRDFGTAWSKFIEKYKNFITDQTLLMERTFDDPSITDTDSCIYDICMTIDGERLKLIQDKINTTGENISTLQTCVIEGGKFAVYHFKGYAWEIYDAYQNMFNVWVPSSNYEIDERYGFDIYHKIDSSALYMEMDCCIPVK